MYILQMRSKLFISYNFGPCAGEAYHMFRFTPIADAKQIQRSLQQESYTLSIPDYTSDFIIFLCEY
jgi:hypothetical protein